MQAQNDIAEARRQIENGDPKRAAEAINKINPNKLSPRAKAALYTVGAAVLIAGASVYLAPTVIGMLGTNWAGAAFGGELAKLGGTHVLAGAWGKGAFGTYQAAHLFGLNSLNLTSGLFGSGVLKGMFVAKTAVALAGTGLAAAGVKSATEAVKSFKEIKNTSKVPKPPKVTQNNEIPVAKVETNINSINISQRKLEKKKGIIGNVVDGFKKGYDSGRKRLSELRSKKINNLDVTPSVVATRPERNNTQSNNSRNQTRLSESNPDGQENSVKPEKLAKIEKANKSLNDLLTIVQNRGLVKSIELEYQLLQNQPNEKNLGLLLQKIIESTSKMEDADKIKNQSVEIIKNFQDALGS